MNDRHGLAPTASFSAAPRVIRLHPEDNVVVALDQLLSGTLVRGENVVVSGLVPPGHKMATREIAVGEVVRRYGQIIGFASVAIRAASMCIRTT